MVIAGMLLLGGCGGAQTASTGKATSRAAPATHKALLVGIVGCAGIQDCKERRLAFRRAGEAAARSHKGGCPHGRVLLVYVTSFDPWGHERGGTSATPRCATKHEAAEWQKPSARLSQLTLERWLAALRVVARLAARHDVSERTIQ